jgi:DNA polymerase-3 subunit epsilon
MSDHDDRPADDSAIDSAAHQLAAALVLERPLVVLDVATTGVEVRRARIVEIAVIRIEPDGRTHTTVKRTNPGVEIPPGATAIHGLDDEAVADEPPFCAYARSLHAQLDDCDFAGFGIERFDLPVLEAEFRRCGLDFEWRDRRIIDALTIFHRQEPRDLGAAMRFYRNEPFPAIHDAGDDARAGLAVLASQLERYSDLPRDMAELNAWCRPQTARWIDATGRFIERNGEPVFAFGQFEGMPLRVVAAEQPGYLAWLSEQGLPDDALAMVREVLDAASPASEG